jgi:hypothetical protein
MQSAEQTLVQGRLPPAHLLRTSKRQEKEQEEFASWFQPYNSLKVFTNTTDFSSSSVATGDAILINSAD